MLKTEQKKYSAPLFKQKNSLTIIFAPIVFSVFELMIGCAITAETETSAVKEPLVKETKNSLSTEITQFSINKSQQKRLALVFGNKDYQYMPLDNPLKDARDMKTALERLGFEVIYQENATLEQIETKVKNFKNKLADKDVGLFYYSGHGIQHDGDNYLIPIDNNGLDGDTLKYKAFNVGILLDSMEKSKQPVSLIILDACRDNPFRGFRSMGMRGLANSSGPTGSIIAYSTAPGNLAADGAPGGNGIYTKHLLANLEKPNLTIEAMLKEVNRGVVKETGARQTPWFNSALSGDFCFVSCPSAEGDMRLQIEAEFKEKYEKELKKQEERIKSLEKAELEKQALANRIKSFENKSDNSLQSNEQLTVLKKQLDQKTKEQEIERKKSQEQLNDLEQQVRDKLKISLEEDFKKKYLNMEQEKQVLTLQIQNLEQKTNNSSQSDEQLFHLKKQLDQKIKEQDSEAKKLQDKNEALQQELKRLQELKGSVEKPYTNPSSYLPFVPMN